MSQLFITSNRVEEQRWAWMGQTGWGNFRHVLEMGTGGGTGHRIGGYSSDLLSVTYGPVSVGSEEHGLAWLGLVYFNRSAA